MTARKCEMCGAPLHGNVCEYCGTEYKDENADKISDLNRQLNNAIFSVNQNKCTAAIIDEQINEQLSQCCCNTITQTEFNLFTLNQIRQMHGKKPI